MAPLDTAGWAHNAEGEVVDGQTRSPEGEFAYFKHLQELQGGNVWRMRVEVGGGALVGIAGEGYDVERQEQTWRSTAYVWLNDGSTFTNSDISRDGEEHYHYRHLEDHIPKTLPYELALRINKDGNMPQLRFNEDGQWHDFAPEGGTGRLKAGRWFPHMCLYPGQLVSDHRVNRPRPVKGAGMN
jgi:hypothetical protein